jgi:hypothetical protein
MKFRTEQKETEKLFTQITIDGKHERNKNYIEKNERSLLSLESEEVIVKMIKKDNQYTKINLFNLRV